MLFYGGTFFTNFYTIWLCGHMHKIFRSCAHAHMIGEHKKVFTFILFLES